MDSAISKQDAEKAEYTVDSLETLIYEWIKRSIYFTTFRLTNFMLKTIAYKFKAILNVQHFEPSQEWVKTFRIKYNIHDVDTTKFDNIGYKCSKSTLPSDIFNELRDQFTSKSNDTFSEVIEIKEEIKEEIREVQKKVKEDEWYTQCVETVKNNEKPNHGSTDTNTNLLLDIEDELPVCTIFGWKSLENKSGVVSMQEPNKSKLNKDNFTNITALNDRSTLNAASIGNKKIEELTGTKTKPVYIDQFLKNIDRLSTADRSKNKRTRCGKTEVKAKECFETNKNPPRKKKSGIFIKQIKSGICDKPKSKCQQKTTITETETKTPNLPPWISTANSISLMPPVIQIAPPLVLPGNMNALCAVQKVITETPQPLQSDKVVYTLNIPTSDQSSLSMPFMSQMPTNIQTSALGQQPNIRPVFVHLHSPVVQVQVNEILSCSQMSPTLVNLQQTAPISQMSYLPSMNMTQQSPPANNLMQNQLTVQTTAMNNQRLVTQATSNYFSTPAVQTLPEVNPNSTMTSVVNFQDSIPTNIVIRATSDTTTSPAYVTNSNKTNLKISQVQSKGFALSAANTFINASKQNTSNIPIVAQIPLKEVGKNVMCTRPSDNIGLSTPSTFSQALGVATRKIIPKPSTKQQPLSRIETVNTRFSGQATAKEVEKICIPAPIASKQLCDFQTPAKFPEAQKIAAKILNPPSCSTDEPLHQLSVLKNITITKTPSPKVTSCATTQKSTNTTRTSVHPSSISQDQRLPIFVKQNLSSSNTISNKLLAPKKIIESNSTSVKKPRTESNTSEGTRFSKCEPLRTKEEVIKCIKLMEDFAMMNDNFRLIGFLERLEKQVVDFQQW